MKYSLVSVPLVSLAFGFFISASPIIKSQTHPAVTNVKKGWIPLFDGKTTSGWHSYGKSYAGAAWIVEDGALHLNISPNLEGGDLVSNEEFSDFHLKLEWKIAPGGNSGVMFYVHEDKEKYEYTYFTGPEMQVLDNDKHPDAKINKHRAGDLYDLIASRKEVVKPVGQWNQAEIKSKNGKLQFFLNGTKVVSTVLWNDDWKKLVSRSKFNSIPSFSIYKTGKISLQDHGDEVWYRNIMIKRL
ncbi:MAG TPA: DUF1080 domain-containing protein [Pedobacter sp.]|jgi:hypothetical protein